ncbi:MAG: hypothetical protein FWF54_03615 [Candidatus Azobacteroides sp.]|nr:hypothetical protein [Candidatus Azobacteroides sp.]
MINFSANRVMGSVIYRTRESLNKNIQFLDNIKRCYFYPTVVTGGKINLWHYPGTQNEISDIFLKLAEKPTGRKLKFPSVFNMQAIHQQRGGADYLSNINYSLIFTAPVVSHWTTPEREKEAFDFILRPIYNEFMNQVQRCGYFDLPYGIPFHDYYEVFTTGESTGHLIKRYGDNFDAIELWNLKLKLRLLCEKDFLEIENESKKVTEIFIFKK